MFTELGYRADPSVAFSQEYGIDRLIYTGHARPRPRSTCSSTRCGCRTRSSSRPGLTGPGPTAQTADLLLAKLQIHEITEKDVKDMAALLASHPVGDGQRGSLGEPRRARVALMARDWGLCHTTLANLATAETLLAGWATAGARHGRGRCGQVTELRERIELAPKSLRWKARASVGERVRWYRGRRRRRPARSGRRRLSGKVMTAMNGDDRDLLLEHMTWNEAQDARGDHRVLIIPIGAIEQHGPHLPLATDAIVAFELARRVARRQGSVVAPAMYYTARVLAAQRWRRPQLRRFHRGHRTDTDRLVRDVTSEFFRTGFRRVAYLNGHYENSPLVYEALTEAIEPDSADAARRSW